MNDKVYIILDDCVWDDEPLTRIVGAYQNKDDALLFLKDYIDEVKKSIDFDNMDAVEITDDMDLCDYEEEMVYSISDDHFELYRNGNYNSDHISINIEVLDLIKEYKKDYEMQV